MMSEQPQPQQRWHVGKEVPIALIAGLFLQTIVFVSWLSDLRNEVRNGSVKIEEIWRDRYTRDDSARDARLISLQMEILRQADVELRRRLDIVESKLGVGAREATK